MSRLLAFGLALALAAPATALPSAPDASPNLATAPPADDAQCDTCDAMDLLQEGDYRRGRHILEMRAAAGDVSAITGLGMMYQRGLGVPIDYDRAMAFYRTAAHEKDPMAFNQIGYLSLHGLGRPADPKSAWCSFEQAAEGGLKRSTYHLAELMAAGLEPVSCTPSEARLSDAADRRQDHGGVSGAALEFWNGVREGMTPDQVASALPAPYHETFSPGAQFSEHPISDVVVAPAALLGHPAIANVTLVNHAAVGVVLNIDPQSDDPQQGRSLALALASRFDAVYGHSLYLTKQAGGVAGAWRRGDLAIQLDYMSLPGQQPDPGGSVPPGFSVQFMRNETDRAPPFPPATIAGGHSGQGG